MTRRAQLAEGGAGFTREFATRVAPFPAAYCHHQALLSACATGQIRSLMHTLGCCGEPAHRSEMLETIRSRDTSNS